MQWSPQQDEALSRVAAWLKSGRPQVFRLFGYAGTGKTTLARHFAEGVDGEVAFAAFTGKAAHVLRSKGCDNAATIHSLIYRPRSRCREEEDGPYFVLNREARRRRPTSSSSTNARWWTRIWAATSCPSACRCWCWAIRRSSPRQGRRLLHRRRARHDADRGAPAGARQPDHPHVDGGARGRRLEPAPTARARSSAATRSTPDRGAARPTRCWSARNSTRRRYNKRIRELKGLRDAMPAPATSSSACATTKPGPAQRRHLDGRRSSRAAA